MGVEEVKHDDGHAGPGDDQSQHQDPGHGRAEGRVEVVGHGALGDPERRARGVAIFALDDGGGGGGVSSWRERERGRCRGRWGRHRDREMLDAGMIQRPNRDLCTKKS